MASNLNKAFMRAYAKDSGRAVPEPAAAAPETARPATAAPSRQQPPEGMPQPAVRSAMPRQLPDAQPINQPTGSAPHFSGQAAAPAQIISGRYVQKGAPAASADPAADAASVWQRIDAAQAVQPPHVAHPQSRPITTSVGVGAASGPKRMHAGAAPAAPAARTADWHEPQPVDLPLLADEPNAPSADPQSLETRRRTVADFLYSAGKIPGSAASPARPIAASAAPPASPLRPLGRAAGASPEVAAVRTSPAVAAGPASLGGNSLGGNAPVLTSQSRASTASAERSYAPVASTLQSPLYSASAAPTAAAVPAPVKLPKPEAVPASIPSPSIQPPSKRTGQILRVDVPNPARQSDADFKRAASPIPQAPVPQTPIPQAPVPQASVPRTPAPQAIDQAMLDEVAQSARAAAPIAGVTGEQRRIDRAHELSEAEQKLRRSKHKIFNPVWEVDSLQWPGVCDKLMEHRAESMAQVAAHLKAACQDGLNILGVTSPTSGEGRTTVACCLARLAAAHGLNVVLIDLDLDHPTLCLQTNLEVERDWRDCLDGDIALEEVAVHSIDDQLTLLPLKDRSDRPELLASDMGIADILRELSESFELVIVDACRMNSSGNVLSGLAAAQIFDAAIVVVDRRNSHQERIEDAVRVLQQTGVGSIGIVDNFSM